MKYYVLVARPEDGSVLALPSSEGWAVPTFTPETTDARVVHHIGVEMRRQLGFDIWTLKCAARGETDDGHWRIFFSVARDSDVAVPEGAKWLSPADATAVNFSESWVGAAIEKWFAELESPPDLRAPWQEIGWHDSACAWIAAELARIGLPATGPVAQDRAWGLSCTMRIATDSGNVFFKATPPFMAHEGRATQAVAEHCPELVPQPLALDSERGWLLMTDYGGEMLHESPDIRRWEEALGVFSTAQIGQVEHAEFWMRQNIPDRRLGRMVEMIDPLIASCAHMLDGGTGGLSEEEIGDLRSLSMPLKLMCARLAHSGIPHTLVHGDLGGNILITETGYTFFDWTDVCISHPFFEMATISGAYFDESVLQDNPNAEIRLRDAYLRPWTRLMPMDKLIESFEASRPLGTLHEMMTYMWIRTNIPADARPELDGGLLHWVRTLLRQFGKGH